MLEPERIKEYRFQPAGQGVYRADDVDRFFASVGADYEALYIDHGKLIDRVRMLVGKVKELEEQIKQYEAQENLIKKTLIVAQKKADEIEETAKTRCASRIETADKEAREKVENAEKRANTLISEADERYKRVLEDVKQKSKSILSGASDTAEKTVTAAKSKAALLLKESKQRADAMIADAQAQVDAVLSPLQAEVAKEKKALESVRAESKAFKKKLTESYYQQIGMTSELLGFVESDDMQDDAPQVEAPAQKRVEPTEDKTADIQPEESYACVADDFFSDIEEVTVSGGASQTQQIEEAVEAIIEAAKTESADIPEGPKTVDTEPVAGIELDDTLSDTKDDDEPKETNDESGFTFVCDFGGFGFDNGDTVDEDLDLPEEKVKSFDDIFQSVITDTAEAPSAEPVKDADKPFGALNEKYSSVPEFEDDLTFDSVFGSPEPVRTPAEAKPVEAQDFVEEPTRQITLPPIEVDEDDETEDEPKEAEPKKTEKKKRRLSLFSKYEDDDDEDEDEDDFDDEDDDFDDYEDDDEDEDGGFKGFFRK